MSNQIVDYKKFRERIQIEDNLLNSRTSIFLVTNGLLMTTVGITDSHIYKIILAILGTFRGSGTNKIFPSTAACFLNI